MDFLKDKVYKPVLNFAMNYPFPMIAICLMSLLMTVGAFQGGLIRSTFFPNLPTERFFINLKLPAGTSTTVTSKVLDRIENAAKELNRDYQEEYFAGKKDVFVKMTRDIGPASNQGTITIYLMPTEERPELTARDLTGLLRDKVGPIYEAEFLQYKVPGGFGNPVDISILGTDYVELESATKEIENALRKMTDLRACGE